MRIKKNILTDFQTAYLNNEILLMNKLSTQILQQWNVSVEDIFNLEFINGSWSPKHQPKHIYETAFPNEDIS